jgi:hypothetical protein
MARQFNTTGSDDIPAVSVSLDLGGGDMGRPQLTATRRLSNPNSRAVLPAEADSVGGTPARSYDGSSYYHGASASRDGEDASLRSFSRQSGVYTPLSAATHDSLATGPLLGSTGGGRPSLGSSLVNRGDGRSRGLPPAAQNQARLAHQGHASASTRAVAAGIILPPARSSRSSDRQSVGASYLDTAVTIYMQVMLCVVCMPRAGSTRTSATTLRVRNIGKSLAGTGTDFNTDRGSVGGGRSIIDR